MFPLVLGAVSIVASMIAVFFVRLGKNEYIMGALYKGMFGSAILAAIAFYFVTTQMMGGQVPGGRFSNFYEHILFDACGARAHGQSS